MSSPKPASWKRVALATGTSLTAFLAFGAPAVAQPGTPAQDTTAATQQDDAIIVTAMKRA